MSSDLSSFPVLPHGGVLVDRIVSAEEAVALRQLASERPALRLDARELADLELIATGAASPLTGFLTESDYASVVEKLRLANGTVWPLPLTLAVPDESKKDVVPGAIVALEDASGRLWGVIDNFFPYRYLIADWDAALRDALPRLDAAADPVGLVTALTEFGELWDAMKPMEKARVLRLLVEQVRYDAGTGQLHLHFREHGLSSVAQQPHTARTA